MNPKTLEGQLTAGQMLGRYEMLLPIAAGGMGNVWAARLKGTRGFRKLVAVKTVLRAINDEKLEQMLFQEATLASQIHHPNVVETIELGEHDGTMYLVMELVYGESLSFILREAVARGGVPLTVAVNLVGQVCRGLQAAHDLTDAYGNPVGLVHRDISPSNVLVTYSGNVKIVDFGVATTSTTSQSSSPEIKGKLSYLAPEQLRAGEVDARVDVYATGLLLYLMTVQKHPFRGASEGETINRILSEQPVTPPSAFVEDYPEGLEAVLLKALEKNRENRYGSAASLLEALESALPEAFGPNGDRQTVEYLQELLKPRMEERRATLRMAEDLAEQSSARDSALSLPAMVSPPPLPSQPSSRANRFAVGAALVAACALALGAKGIFLKGPTQHHASAAIAAAVAGDPVAPQSLPAPAAPAAPTSLVASPATPEAPASAAIAEERAAPSLASAPHLVAHRGARGERSEHGAGPAVLSDVAAYDAGAAAAPSASATPEADAAAALQVGSGLALAPSAEVTAQSAQPTTVNPPPAALAPSAPVATAERDLVPRRVGSRIGNARLAVNPGADGYRARIPRALERTQQSFRATVDICVNTDGKV
ncbi:MAG TPA: serine/threonine-protein kinase, partial [Polyangiaceae bacterium]|nr:serine/threonine-protein kinase [Polyangiaceae bacterium]